MTMRFLLICSIVLAMMTACTKNKDDSEKNFKVQFLNSFVSSCTKTGMQKGLKEADVKKRCDCIGNFLTGKYSAAELTKITAADSPETNRIFDEAVKACR